MLLALVVAFPAVAGRDAPADYSRAPDQPVDQSHTDLIATFTTEPPLNSPLTDYLPASDPLPTTLDDFGRIAGCEAGPAHIVCSHPSSRVTVNTSPTVTVHPTRLILTG